MDQFLDSWHSYRFRYCSVNNLGLVSEFGDIIFDNGSYKFMTFDDEEVILEIIADEILEVDR